MKLFEWIKVGDTRRGLTLRHYTPNDFDALIDVQRACFPPPFPEELLWNKEQLHEHVTRFPDGAVCACIEDTIVGSITTLITQYKRGDQHAWAEVTDDGYIRNHQPDGNTLYVVDISVDPQYRSLGIGKKLLQGMYLLVVEKGLERLLGGGRMPGYHIHAENMSAEAYLDKVLAGELKDPVISFMLNAGRIPYGVVHNYLEDEESMNCAALMAWENPFKNIS